MTHEDESAAIRKRLDIIIMLLMESGGDGARTITDRIHRLLDFGLKRSEVGDIVGKPTNYVGAVASKRKARPNRKKRAKAAPSAEKAEAND